MKAVALLRVRQDWITEVIVKSHKHVVGIMQERYGLSTRSEKEEREQASISVSTGNKVVVTEGYALVRSTFKAKLRL